MKISIITVVRNRSKTIADTLLSLKSQVGIDFEHIIIDGSSTDGTQNIVLKHKSTDSIFISEEDDGVYDAMNKGIKLSTGDIVGFLHSDDVYSNPNVLAQIHSIFLHANVDIVYADLNYVDSVSSNKILRNWISGDFKSTKLKYGWMPPHPTFFCKRSLFDNFGLFNTSYKISSDYDLMVRFLKSPNVIVYYYPFVITFMKVGGISNNSISNIKRKMIEDFSIIKNNNIGNIFTLIFKNLRKISQFNSC